MNTEEPPPEEAEKPLTPEAELLLWRVEKTVQTAAWASLTTVLIALCGFRALNDKWILQIAVFVGVATAPQSVIDRVAQIAEKLSPDLPDDISKRSFRNLGAFVGLVERPLFLAAFVAGRPELVAGWFVFKGIAGYRLGLDKEQRKERRLFQLFLLNNAMSLGGGTLGFLAWEMLRL